jgi:lysophospholipase L1-like esterase
MQQSDFYNWEKGIFSAVRELGGPDTTDEIQYYRRDHSGVNYKGNIYTQDQISYKWNSYGFRCNEFKENTRNILCLGDSFTVGLGVPVEHTWPMQLGKLYDPTIEVYNLGLCAGSLDYVLRAIHKTIDILKPEAICILAPLVSNRELPMRKKMIPFKPSAIVEDNVSSVPFESLAPLLLDPTFIEYTTTRNIQHIKEICNSRNIPVAIISVENFSIETFKDVSAAEFLKFSTTVQRVETHSIGSELNLPFGRDGFHFGKEWNSVIAQLLMKELNNGK